jgi:hypothetical protein
MNDSRSVFLATTAAALFASGYGFAAEQVSPPTSEALVHCAGINACRGTSECKSATNACKGQNSCARAGWISTKRADCEAKGGKVVQ